MAIAPRRYVSPNPPSAPPVGGGGGLKFPKDLTAGGRNFTTSIFFQRYTGGAGPFGGGFGTAGGLGGGSITLPIPRKINDVQTVVWEEASMVSAALGASNTLQGLSTAGAFAGAAVNLRLNPALIMMFKQPNFKEWNFQWTLAANSPDESQTIADIVREFKRNMSPTKAGAGGMFYGYPAVARVSFNPNERFLTRLKPAAIMAVQTDFTAAGQPSFFNNGAPTIVNLTVSMRETELWTAEDFVF
mgnify:CR=1 FL=1